MVLLAFMARYRRPECPDCGHCRIRLLDEQNRKRETQHDYEHRVMGECRDVNCTRKRDG